MCVVLVALSGRGVASPDRPWAEGVSETDQKTAFELYDAGNREFAEEQYARALVWYRKAIAHWDHPAIRFNIVVCLISLDQPLEAHENLERSLAYGPSALPAEHYSQALLYRKLLDAQLVHVTVTSRQPGVEVTLDGKVLFTAPGSVERVVRPGDHQVVASKLGFSVHTKTLVLVAGTPTTYDVAPLELVTTSRMVRRWPAWVPWSALAAGAGLGGAGAWSYVAARRNFERYDRTIAARCGQRCSAEQLAGFADLHRYERRGDLEQIVAFSLFAVSGVAVVGGLVGIVMNQPRLQQGPTPVVEVSGAGASASLRWAF